MAATGRKSKLTKELIEKAAQLIAAGNYAQTVCHYLNIGVSTWYEWIEKGNNGRGWLYAEFAEAIKKAESTAEMRAVTAIQSAGKKNWQAYAWYLERKFPEKWAKKDYVQQQTETDVNVYVNALKEAVKEVWDEEAANDGDKYEN